MEKINKDNIEVIDLQEYAETNKRPPVGKHYQTLVDHELVKFEKEKVTGREVLLKAGKRPPECFSLYIKRNGCEPDRISLDELIDLTSPGVEIFFTKPPEIFYYSVDDEPETTDLKEMTPRQILEAAGVDPAKHYLIQVLENGEQIKYKDNPDQPIKMRCPQMKFISVLSGPCPFS
jgi:hypothetical protein